MDGRADAQTSGEIGAGTLGDRLRQERDGTECLVVDVFEGVHAED